VTRAVSFVSTLTITVRITDLRESISALVASNRLVVLWRTHGAVFTVPILVASAVASILLITAHGLCTTVAIELIVASERTAREEDASSRAVVAIFVAIPNRSACVAVSAVPLVGAVAMTAIDTVSPNTVRVAFAVDSDSAQLVAVWISAVVESISTSSAIQ
jgi:hypothetical protein